MQYLITKYIQLQLQITKTNYPPKTMACDDKNHQVPHRDLFFSHIMSNLLKIGDAYLKWVCNHCAKLE
jgi:hypothetical protein